MGHTLKIEIGNGEEIRIEANGQAQLLRDGALIAAPRFATRDAAQQWANGIIERAAKSRGNAQCPSCGE